MVEYLYMGGLKLKTIPCSLVKSFPRLRWWDLRFLLYMANVLPLYCCQHIIANILYCQSISCSNCLPSNSRDNRIIHLPPALAYHPCLEVPCIFCIWKRNTKCVCYVICIQNSRTSFNMNFRFSFWRTTCYLNSHLFLGLCLSWRPSHSGFLFISTNSPNPQLIRQLLSTVLKI